MKYVRCNKADDPRCVQCGHEEPHTPIAESGDEVCTKWGTCIVDDKELFKVRCVKLYLIIT